MIIGKLYSFSQLNPDDYMLIYDKLPHEENSQVIDEIRHGDLAVLIQIDKDLFSDPLLKILKANGTIGWVMCHPLFFDWKEVE